MQSKKNKKQNNESFGIPPLTNNLEILTCYACIGFTIPKRNMICKFIEIRTIQTQVAHTCS